MKLWRFLFPPSGAVCLRCGRFDRVKIYDVQSSESICPNCAGEEVERILGLWSREAKVLEFRRRST